MGTPPVDPLEYRRVVGHFATGVTVVTANLDGEHWGMTANAFTSVSLEPLLVLVAVDRTSRFHAAVADAGAFAVNVLADDQEALSRRFAVRGATDRFAGVPYSVGAASGAVLLDDAVANLECQTYAVHEGGDHSLVVGEVLAVATPRPDASPLLFFRGAYRTLP